MKNETIACNIDVFKRVLELAITKSSLDTAHFFWSNIVNKDIFKEDLENKDYFFNNLVNKLSEIRMEIKKDDHCSGVYASGLHQISNKLLTSKEISLRAIDGIQHLKRINELKKKIGSI